MATGSSVYVFYITGRARETAEAVRGIYPEAEVLRYSAAEVESRWPSARAMIVSSKILPNIFARNG